MRTSIVGTRLLPALLGVATMVGLAAPAYGNPNDVFDDAGFLATVRDAGLNYTSSAEAIAFAKGVCGSMGSGKSGPELIRDLQNDNPGLTTDHAALFVAISAKYYCPGNSPRNPVGPYGAERRSTFRGGNGNAASLAACYLSFT